MSTGASCFLVFLVASPSLGVLGVSSCLLAFLNTYVRRELTQTGHSLMNRRDFATALAAALLTVRTPAGADVVESESITGLKQLAFIRMRVFRGAILRI